MKLKLTQDGFSTYTGQMGVIFFEDGLSTADVSTVDAVRMSAVMQCEWEDGTSPSIAQSLIDNSDTPAEIIAPESERMLEVEGNAAGNAEGGNEDANQKVEYVFDEATLHQIADKEGIKGLRQAAEPYGVKGNSIKDLIESLLKITK